VDGMDGMDANLTNFQKTVHSLNNLIEGSGNLLYQKIDCHRGWLWQSFQCELVERLYSWQFPSFGLSKTTLILLY
jgi:hypothetical protein